MARDSDAVNDEMVVAGVRVFVGGLWVLECADLDEALAWRRKAAIACRVPVEVRTFH